MASVGNHVRELSLGDRIEATDGSRGWIRHIGPIDGKGAAIWFGVEWDDPERGKHDGTFEGKQYFVCAQPGRRASFVKERMLRPRRTLESAMVERYSSQDQASTVVAGSGSLSTSMSSLSVCSVQKSLVAHASGTEALLAPSVTDLDVSSNLISRWEDVLELAMQFPSLTCLTVSNNRISTPPSPPLCGILSSLKVLVLASMRLRDAETVAVIVAACPKLQQLVLHDNDLSDLAPLPDPPASVLTDIDLSANRLGSWNALSALQGLPMLSRLNLSDNPLVDITPAGATTQGWCSLSELNVSRTQLHSWASISACSRFPALRSLRAANVQLAGEGSLDPETIRQGIVGRLGKLSVLNGSEISADERLDAEKRHLRWLLEQQKERGSDADIDPRLSELSQKLHMFALADLPGGAANDRGLPTISQQLIEVGTDGEARAGNFHAPFPADSTQCGQISSQSPHDAFDRFACNSHQVTLEARDHSPVSKMLPSGTSVRTLKLLARKLLGIRTTSSLTCIHDATGEPHHVDLCNENMTLREISAESSIRILVEP